MDMNKIRYFHVFSETGSLVKASGLLHISQPALSKALRLLQQEVGLKLLEADGRGLSLTADGIMFRKATSNLLLEWLQLPNKLKSIHSQKGIKLGSFEVFTTYFLRHLSKNIDLEGIEVHEYAPGQLEQAIIDRIVDIGITYIPIPKTEIEFIEVTKIEMGIFGIKKFAKIPWENLPFIVPLSPLIGTPSKVVGLDGWPDHKFKRQIKFHVTMMESAIELCRNGKGVAYLPLFVVELHNQIIQSDFK